MARPDVAVMREAIHAWIRDDVPLGMKMMIRPEHVTALAERLEAARSTGTGRSEAEAMAHLLREAEPTLLRQSNDIILYCPDGTITDDLYDALDRACYGPTALNPPAREGEGDHG